MNKYEALLSVTTTLLRVQHGDESKISWDQISCAIDKSSTLFEWGDSVEKEGTEDKVMDEICQKWAYRVIEV
jgi:hypothetical protein